MCVYIAIIVFIIALILDVSWTSDLTSVLSGLIGTLLAITLVLMGLDVYGVVLRI